LNAADRGQREEAHTALGAMRNRHPDYLRACRAAVDSRLWLTNPAEAPLPTREQLATFCGSNEETRSAASLACSAAATSCMLRRELPELERYNELNAELLGSMERGVAACWLTVGRAWADVIRGAGRSVSEALESLRSKAVDSRAAVLVVESTALRALAALNDGAIAEAIERARRASRMARTEAIPRAEFIAHLILARTRRISGKPHLANRILSSLLRFAAQPWHPWMLWELTLAGGQADVSKAELGEPWPLTHDVQALLAATEREDRAGFDQRLQCAKSAVQSWSWLAKDVRVLAHSLDPTILISELDPAVAPWARGETPETPHGLHGLCTSPNSPESDEAAVAYVIAGPGTVARRILPHGLGLLQSGETRIAQMRRRSGRLDSAAAALALAGPEGLESTEFFRSVYGFAYAPELHRGVIKTLVHRLRARLEDVALVHSDAGRLALEPRTSLILPDPRCSAPLNDRVLWLLSTKRGITARKAAQQLGLPLRTVQTALRELVEDGLCESLRTGRNVRYQVEDTTFSEPTQVLRGWSKPEN
jgi:DNA-binding transcriptional ArsR family regulator